MPSKLLERLNYYYDETTANNVVMPVQHAPATAAKRWPPITVNNNFGSAVSPVNSVIIHETSGRPTYEYKNSMGNEYTNPNAAGIGPQLYISGNGAVYRFMGIDPPFLTNHSGYMNGVSIGIENGTLGDDVNLGPASTDPNERARWRTLKADATKPEDLTGMNAFMLLHPDNAQEGVIVWIAAADYAGPENASQAASRNFRRMLFTEPNYRSLALLCRYLAELFGIPRNFPALPYVTMDQQSGPPSVTTGDGGLPQAQIQAQLSRLRQLILCDERSDLLSVAAGSTAALITSNDASLLSWYGKKNIRQTVNGTNSQGQPFTINYDHNGAWTGMMSNSSQGYRGFAGHGFVGDTAKRDSHSMCPGPFFDWHRFAREVWDWWWFCFDFVQDPAPATTVQLSTSQRPYRKATSTTTLREYFFDADGKASDYTAARVANDSNLSAGNVFLLPKPAPVFAMANGVVVAARLSNPATNSTAPSNGFVLIRHEVFHLTNPTRIDYDSDPSYVYSLTYHIDQPGIVFDNLSDNNPDWYNRFLVRLTEAELAVAFVNSHPTDNPLQQQAWPRRLGGSNTRSLLSTQITADANAYRAAADLLSKGEVAFFPIESQPGATPVRVALGDFLGVPGVLAPTLSPSGQKGVLIDIFSASQLGKNFSLMLTPDPPAARQKTVMASAEQWWPQMCDFIKLETDPAKTLPKTDPVWHYDMVDFLTWLNGVTWTSEWQKYGLFDIQHPNTVPPRPKTRKTAF